MLRIRLLLLVSLSFLLASCVSIPQGVTPVTDFQVERYLGKWYEIRRLDHSFERGLSNVTAEYSLRADGDIQVLNSGFNEKTGKWSLATGHAKFVGSPTTGRLKVSFFGPFYGGYNIVALDKNYQHVLIVGNDTNSMWILARQPQLPEATLQALLSKAAAIGIDTNQLLKVDQRRARP